jgi:hypothetical protein
LYRPRRDSIKTSHNKYGLSYLLYCQYDITSVIQVIYWQYIDVSPGVYNVSWVHAQSLGHDWAMMRDAEEEEGLCAFTHPRSQRGRGSTARSRHLSSRPTSSTLKCPPMETDVLAWWSLNEMKFLALGVMVRQQLGV